MIYEAAALVDEKSGTNIPEVLLQFFNQPIVASSLSTTISAIAIYNALWFSERKAEKYTNEQIKVITLPNFTAIYLSLVHLILCGSSFAKT